MIAPQDLIAEHPEQLFRDFLSANKHPLDGQLNNDPSNFHYFHCPNGGKTDARYKFHSDGIPSGYFKCWHCDIEADFCSKHQHEITPLELKAHNEILTVRKRQHELETQQEQAAVAALAKLVFAAAHEEKAEEHGYLRLKQIKNYGARIILNQDENTKKAQCYVGTLLIPCYNANDELVNLERIYFDRQSNKYQKRPLTGGVRRGAFSLLGEVTE